MPMGENHFVGCRIWMYLLTKSIPWSFNSWCSLQTLLCLLMKNEELLTEAEVEPGMLWVHTLGWDVNPDQKPRPSHLTVSWRLCIHLRNTCISLSTFFPLPPASAPGTASFTPCATYPAHPASLWRAVSKLGHYWQRIWATGTVRGTRCPGSTCCKGRQRASWYRAQGYVCFACERTGFQSQTQTLSI